MPRWTWYSSPEEEFPPALQLTKPLHIAADKGYAHIARILIAYGACVDGEDQSMATPLHYASSNGQTAMVHLLLDYGANPNAVDLELDSPCICAAKGDHLDSIQALINRGADIHLRSQYEDTALKVAAESGATKVFAFLMTTSTPYLTSRWDGSTLYDALSETSAFPMSLLLSLAPSAEAYKSQRFNILNAAVQHRPRAEVRMLLQRIPPVLLSGLLNHRASDWAKGTPIYAAIIASKLENLDLLLDTGAQLEIEGSEHGTPLMAACACGRLAAVKLLVARGARTSYVKDGQVYSAFAAARYHQRVRRWLLVGRFVEGPRLLTY